jgi:hypothetical protein
MGFLKKIKFWKKRNNNTPIKVDASVSTEDPQTCDAATVSMDPPVMCATYTQTETRMDGGDCGGAVKDECECELEKKHRRSWNERRSWRSRRDWPQTWCST